VSSDPSPPPRRRRRRHYVAIGALILVVLLLVLQLVPYGRDHTSPTATKQVELATAQQRELFRTACQDCHSYNTDWLWYSNVAPVSWLIQSDVDGGREHFNLSTWDRPQPELSDVVDQIENGEMPPLKYWISPYHWNARLSDTEKRQLIAGFRALYASDPPPIGHGA
jgi:hypothetical protein